jgi:hypothetical protein
MILPSSKLNAANKMVVPPTRALQDVRLIRDAESEDGDRGLHEAATRHRDQRESTKAGALLARARFSRSAAQE